MQKTSQQMNESTAEKKDTLRIGDTEFLSECRKMLDEGQTVLVTAKGGSMFPLIHDGDKVLLSEGCTHHRQCEDIGTVKIPRWLAACTGRTLQYDFCSGVEFPEDLTPYALVVHCGGCTLNPKEMAARQRLAVDQAVPITNYGVLIAAVHGILPRTLQPFPAIAALL